MMQTFFDQVKALLADSVVSSTFSLDQSNCVYFELKYRDNKVEIDYCGFQRRTIGSTFILSIDLGLDFELKILPKSYFDRLFGAQAGISLFQKAKRIKIQTPIAEEEFVLHTNNEEFARDLLTMSDVSKIVYDYGIAFFKIENGELKVYLDELSDEKFAELKSNPALIIRYLDTTVDLAQHIKVDCFGKG